MARRFDRMQVHNIFFSADYAAEFEAIHNIQRAQQVGSVDAIVPAVELLQRLAPFGPDNPRVRLATTPVTLVGAPRAVGTNGQHLQFSVQQGREQRKAIAFGRGRDAAALADCPQLRVAFEPLINEFNGQRRVELRVLDWQPVS